MDTEKIKSGLRDARADGLKELQKKYGNLLLEDFYRIDDNTASKIFDGQRVYDVRITGDGLRSLLFSNVQLHDGLAALLLYTTLFSSGDYEGAAKQSVIATTALASSNNQFRAFFEQLLLQLRDPTNE